MLDRVIHSTADKTIVCLGSKDLVEASLPAMQESLALVKQ